MAPAWGTPLFPVGLSRAPPAGSGRRAAGQDVGDAQQPLPQGYRADSANSVFVGLPFLAWACPAETAALAPSTQHAQHTAGATLSPNQTPASPGGMKCYSGTWWMDCDMDAGRNENFFFFTLSLHPSSILPARCSFRCKIRKRGAGEDGDPFFCFCRRCGCHMSGQSLFWRFWVWWWWLAVVGGLSLPHGRKVRHQVPVHVHTTVSAQVHGQCNAAGPLFLKISNCRMPTFRAWSEIAR